MARILSISIILLFSVGFTKCANDQDVLNELAISDEVKNDLSFLLEEEKLARDVYLYAYDLYQVNIFNNISQSEQKHMDAVKVILNKYGLSDNIADERGVFGHIDIQNLYNDYIAMVDRSLVDALTVGITIEDLDIKDLNLFKTRAEQSDIINMYNKLACGSGNHLRAFYGQLTSNGATYEPQFLTQEEFDEVLNTEHQSCGSLYRMKQGNRYK